MCHRVLWMMEGLISLSTSPNTKHPIIFWDWAGVVPVGEGGGRERESSLTDSNSGFPSVLLAFMIPAPPSCQEPFHSTLASEELICLLSLRSGCQLILIHLLTSLQNLLTSVIAIFSFCFGPVGLWLFHFGVFVGLFLFFYSLTVILLGFQQ